ncbi:MAG: hypothetical protein K2J82_08925 [Muribaculaceae bacterium]|nr:hypothetical protein [Muribaculaceae bacterium]
MTSSEIISAANRVRLFDSSTKPSKAKQGVIENARQWIAEVESSIELLPPAERLPLLADYDLIHRIAWSRPASDTFLNRHIHNVFDIRMRQGKESGIDDNLLFLLISDSLTRRRDKSFFGAPLQWYSRTLEKWVRLTDTEEFDRLSPTESRAIANNLLRSDLYAYVPHQETYKANLIKRLKARGSRLKVIG